VDQTFQEAPFFYWLYTLLIAGGAAVILIPDFPLIKVTILSQVLNGVLLPIVILLMLLLINRKDLMGTYVNSWLFNVVAWVTAVVVIGLSVVMMVQALRA
jgi:Mn2+/Fe2+ NRAMP family transporter